METLDECLTTARDRLYPSIFNPNYLVLRRRREIFTKWFSTLPGMGWHVLDIGGRYQPYKPLTNGKVESYVAIDIQPTPLVNVVARGEFLPFSDEAFDLVIATQVFDYFEAPGQAAAEVHRVLKPGGHLVISVPSFAPAFADQERWRYLPAGLRTLFAAFSSVEIVPEIRSIGSFLRTLNLYLTMVAGPAWLRYGVNHSLVPLFNLVGWELERLIPSHSHSFAANYSVLVTK